MKIKSNRGPATASTETLLGKHGQEPEQPAVAPSDSPLDRRHPFLGYGGRTLTFSTVCNQAPWISPVDYDHHAPYPGGSYGVRLLAFEEIAKTITNSRHLFYQSASTANGNPRWKATPLGKFFRELNSCTALNVPGCPHTEHVKLFFKHFYALGFQNVYFTRPSDPAPATDISKGSFQVQAEMCNELARVMQLEGKTQAFKDRIAAIDEKAFEVVLVRESQTIKDLQEQRNHISKLRDAFLQDECGIDPRHCAQSEEELAASRQSLAQVQLNRFAIARLQNAKRLIDRQLVIANAWQGELIARLCTSV